MIKLIASDLDGTLLQNGAQKLNPEIFPIIRELCRRGIVFAAASGRQYPNLRRLFAPVWREMLFIAENGALVMHHGEALAKTPVPRGLGLAIMADIQRRDGCEVLLSGLHTSYLQPKNREYVDLMLCTTRNTVTIVDDLGGVDEPFLKISAYRPGGIADLADDFLRRWGGEVNAAVSGREWIDFTVSTKGSAIGLVRERFGFAKGESAAFGDNYNDVPMLEAVGSGFLMENAAGPLKERFPLRCARVEDTLSAFLRTGTLA